MGIAETVTLEDEVETGIVWLFSWIEGGRDAELPEERVISELNGRFAAWQVREALGRLRELGVTVSATRPRDAVVRRCWRVDRSLWETVRLSGHGDPFA